jgi:CheY-like chemotaxis protein
VPKPRSRDANREAEPPADEAPIGPDDVLLVRARILERLAPGVAHDLVNQVGGIQSFVQVVDRFDDRDRRLLAESAAKALETVRALQGLVRTRRTGPTEVAPAALVAEALALAAHPLQEVAVTVEVDDDLPVVRADPGDLREALLAVLINAMDDMGWPLARGRIRVEGRRAGRGVELVVEHDAAPGSGQRSLDLAVARFLLRTMGGELHVQSDGRRGNGYVLELPVQPGGPASGGDVPSTAAAPGADQPGAVLVCDDDDAIRALIVRVLRRDGLEALGADSGDAALAVLADRPVRLVVADHHLGGMSGLDLYRRALDGRPGLRGKFVLVSGDAGDPDLVAFAREEGLPIVEKPFDVNELARLVHEAATR